MRVFTTLVLGLTAPLMAQDPDVYLTGNLILRWSGTGPVQVQAGSVTPPSSVLQVDDVGLATCSLNGGVVSASVTAEDPPAPPGAGWWSLAQVDAFTQYSTSVPTAGSLRIFMAPVCSSESYLDVGLDGSPELGGAHTRTVTAVPVVLSEAALPIEMRAEATNFGGATCSHVSTVEFLPQVLNLDTVGPACGPHMSAALTTDANADRMLRLWVVEATGSTGAFVVGASPGPAWPFACPLLTDILVAIPAMPASGRAQLGLPINPAAIGTFRLQYLDIEVLPLLDVRTSNAVIATVP